MSEQNVRGRRRPAAQQKSTVLYNPDAPLEPSSAMLSGGTRFAERVDCGRRVPRMGGCE